MKKAPKNAEKYFCEKCDFICFKKSDYERHLLTRKHVFRTFSNDFTPKNAKAFQCKRCNKQYSVRNSLWYHEKKCLELDKNSNNDLLMMLVKENIEFKNIVLDAFQKINTNTMNNTMNNTINNKTFNLNIFLNEQCKDAMNIMDFVESLKLQISDLENIGKVGFVEGISNIIINNLKNLDITQRPVHCSDSKREVIYVKDENIWHNDSKEENEKNKKLKKAIKYVAHKNTKLLSEYKEKYPDCIHSDSTKSDIYNKIVIEAFGGSGNDNENKIIKNLAKEIVINKNVL